MVLFNQFRYFSGFTWEPSIKISKWTWGPELIPVLPLKAIFCPWDTVCPADTSTLLKCPYLVWRPSAWLI